MQLNYHALNVSIHEMGLLYRASPPTRSPNPQIVPLSSATSPRATILFTCLSATKSYYETVLSLPSPAYRHLSFSIWTHLIFVTFILYKLSLGPINIPEWDTQASREVAKIEIYLEALCFRLQNIGVEAHPGNPLKVSMFSMFRLIFENVRATYLKLKNEENPDVENITPHVAFSELTKHEKRSKRRGCPAFPYLPKEAFRGNGDGNGLFGTSFYAAPDLPDDPDFWNSLLASGPLVEQDDQSIGQSMGFQV